MKITPTAISGVAVVETNVFTDHRGEFARLFCVSDLAGVIGNRHIAQVNISRTKNPGAVRGMHFQRPPHAETKFVRCIKGAVWDVVVDLRAGSPTLLQWHAEELTAKNARMLVVPEGCAHGFQVLERDSELLYLHTELYAPEAEDGISYDDPLVAISWPLPISELSVRDRQHLQIPSNYSGIKI